MARRSFREVLNMGVERAGLSDTDELVGFEDEKSKYHRMKWLNR